MNRFANRVRVFAGVLALVLLLLALPGCRKGEETSGSAGAPVLQADGEGGAVLTASLDAAALRTHAGQAARLYALAPGETAADTAGKTPLGEQEVSSRLRFSFALDGEGLYRTYAVVFSDGTLLPGTPVSLNNPEALAANSEAFPNANAYKGLYAGDEQLSRALYSAHTAVKLELPALLAGIGFQAALGSTVLDMDAELLARCDAQVSAAAAAGMQVSLELRMSADLSLAEYAVLFDALAARYEAVSAFVIGELPEGADGAESAVTADSATAAELYRLAYLALVSRRAQGRVYLMASGGDAEDFLLEAAGQVSALASYPFGAALCPAPSTSATVSASDDSDSESGASALLLSDLTDTVQSLRLALGRSFRFCVAGVEFPADDLSLQAALMTYCYRAAVNANADFVILGAQSGENCGLYDGSMLPRTAARVFAGLDCGDNAEGEMLAANLLGEDWSALTVARPDRVAVQDAANLGTSGDPGERWMEFTGAAGEDYPVFSLVGAGAEPGTVDSAVWGTPVLSAALLPTLCPDGSGYRCTLPSAEDLERVYVLSARLMPQSPAAGQARMTLRLDGTAADGRALSYTASVTVSCNVWQEISFHIRGFTSQMDTSAPCTLTFSMLPVADTADSEVRAVTEGAANADSAGASVADAPYALLLHSVNLRTAAPDYTALWIVLLVLGGFGIGFLAVFLPARRKRRRR